MEIGNSARETAAHPATIEWANNEMWIILNSSELDYNTTRCKKPGGASDTKDKNYGTVAYYSRKESRRHSTDRTMGIKKIKLEQELPFDEPPSSCFQRARRDFNSTSPILHPGAQITLFYYQSLAISCLLAAVGFRLRLPSS